MPVLEHKLHQGKNRSVKALVQSKLGRMDAILEELQEDRWLSNQLRRHDELVKQIEALRKAVAEAKAASEQLEGKK